MVGGLKKKALTGLLVFHRATVGVWLTLAIFEEFSKLENTQEFHGFDPGIWRKSSLFKTVSPENPRLLPAAFHRWELSIRFFEQAKHIKHKNMVKKKTLKQDHRLLLISLLRPHSGDPFCGNSLAAALFEKNRRIPQKRKVLKIICSLIHSKPFLATPGFFKLLLKKKILSGCFFHRETNKLPKKHHHKKALSKAQNGPKNRLKTKQNAKQSLSYSSPLAWSNGRDPVLTRVRSLFWAGLTQEPPRPLR